MRARPGIILLSTLLATACASGDRLDSTHARAIEVLADPHRAHADRWNAVLALEGGPADAIGPLAALLDDPASRYYAVRALGYLGRPAASTHLARVLLDQSWLQRRYAALAIGQIGQIGRIHGIRRVEAGAEVVRALERALDDALPAVRDEALLALTRLDEPAAQRALARFYGDHLSTGLRLEVSAERTELATNAGALLSIELTNQTAYELFLPPPTLVLLRGLEISDDRARRAFPRPGDELRRPGAGIEAIALSPGEKHRIELTLALERWDAGEPFDHQTIPGPPRWSIRAGDVQYLLHPEFRGGPLTIRAVWHPMFARELIAQSPRRAGFWTGKAAGEHLQFTILETP